NLFDALRTEESARKVGLGKLLLLAGIAELHDLGFKTIQISGDLTIGQSGSYTKSFYGKYGARPHGNRYEILDTSNVAHYHDYLREIFKQHN
ncbi:MAG: hypothetical protein ABIO02_04405, partial [Patescibacteria group bacterium]